jgi:3-dehydroquinate synthase
MNHPWPSKNVFFTGFMASGKSRIGEQTAKMMNWHFVDTDRYIEEKQGRSISSIFSEEGEPYFREQELKAIIEICENKHTIISLGGGALTQPEVLKFIQQNGILVRLDASIKVLSERIGRKNTRPLLAGLSDDEREIKISEMLKIREPYYQQADFAIESDEKSSVESIVKKLKQFLIAWSYKKIHVKTPSANYPIFIGDNYLDLLKPIFQSLEIDADFLIVTDNNVANKQHHNLRKIQKQSNGAKYFRFPPGEEFKNLQTLNRLFTYMLRKGYSRKTCLLQFSGGVTGDMAGFGAATYQRGIPFVQIPTTLLSMVDSSVGGKVAVNHQLGKNMIGAFYQPAAVLINLDVLSTLEHTEYLAGLAEVIKYGVIWDESFFTYLEENVELLLKKDMSILAQVVEKCCQIKAVVVSQDEKEAGIRAILNYGHTFGHAIEKVTEYQQFSHGIAVSLGMRCAARLATKLSMWEPQCEKRQNDLLDALGFPKIYDMDSHLGWQAMGVDKKMDKGDRVFILPSKIGAVEKVKNPDKEKVNQSWDAIRP